MNSIIQIYLAAEHEKDLQRELRDVTRDSAS